MEPRASKAMSEAIYLWSGKVGLAEANHRRIPGHTGIGHCLDASQGAIGG